MFLRRPAVNRFAYMRDPLCLVACGLYLLNRLWWRGHFGGAFFSGHFNDLLLIPAALPFALWVQRVLRLRPDDSKPAWREIALHVTAWSFAAEAVMPYFTTRATGDWLDVLAYAAGAVIAGRWWHSGTWR
jgi:hypothetical protein